MGSTKGVEGGRAIESWKGGLVIGGGRHIRGHRESRQTAGEGSRQGQDQGRGPRGRAQRLGFGVLEAFNSAWSVLNVRSGVLLCEGDAV
jgi:hypothetical protein